MDLKFFIVSFLLINACFWGLFSHKTHCEVAAFFGVKQCPPHWVHVYVMGILSFVLAISIQQNYLKF